MLVASTTSVMEGRCAEMRWQKREEVLEGPVAGLMLMRYHWASGCGQARHQARDLGRRGSDGGTKEDDAASGRCADEITASSWTVCSWAAGEAQTEVRIVSTAAYVQGVI